MKDPHILIKSHKKENTSIFQYLHQASTLKVVSYIAYTYVSNYFTKYWYTKSYSHSYLDLIAPFLSIVCMEECNTKSHLCPYFFLCCCYWTEPVVLHTYYWYTHTIQYTSQFYLLEIPSMATCQAFVVCSEHSF